MNELYKMLLRYNVDMNMKSGRESINVEFYRFGVMDCREYFQLNSEELDTKNIEEHLLDLLKQFLTRAAMKNVYLYEELFNNGWFR